LGIAHLLSLSINDYQNPLQILAPKPGLGAPSQQGFGAKPYNEMPVVISGVYAVEENLDKKYIITGLPLAQVLLEKNNSQISGINFRLAPTAEIKEVREEIMTVLGDKITLLNRRQLNNALYKMLNTENLATYLIFTLVLIIALFNVVGAIIMMILDKQQNSKTLYSLGVTIKQIRRVYFVQGIIVTSMGGLIGLFLASLLIWSQLAFGWLRITPSLAYPVEYKLMNVVVVLITIVVLGILASKIASSRVSKKLLS
ncbi:MAG: FtsX-like permease family protein, partial [Eudoraea sp.]